MPWIAREPLPMMPTAPRLVPRSRRRSWLLPLGALMLATLGGCTKGTAIVTLTASQPATGLDAGAASPRNFLAYRVHLVSVQLTTADGKTSLQTLPASTPVDLARLVGLSEVLGAVSAAKQSYSSVAITLDYGSAKIVVDDGSASGISLTPLDPSGQPLGQITLSVQLDPNRAFSVADNQTSRLALDFKLAASNAVDLTGGTVTVTPMIAASAVGLDTKTVRIAGSLVSADTSNITYLARISSFDGQTSGGGQLTVAPSSATTYEIDGTPSSGAAGFAQLAASSAGAFTAAYGSLQSAGNSRGGNVTFAATRVLVGSSVQSAQFDRLTGIVSARNGDTLTMPSATLVASSGVNSYLGGISTVRLGSGTAVTLPAQASELQTNGIAQISVGSRIVAFGAASTDGSGNVALDATAGRVRLAETTASGLVASQGTGTLNVALSTLGGRTAAGFSFSGTGAAAGNNSNPNQYVATTGGLALSNAAVGTPVELSGLVASFGAAGPDFAATALLDQTTIRALLAVDWGSSGSPAPFAAVGGGQIDLNIHDANIGLRHRLVIGAQTIDVGTLPADVLIVPDGSATAQVFEILHLLTSTAESFNSFADFAAALQTDLNGTTAATGLTADGTYASASRTLAATSVTISLAD